ncbi:DNA cytosine methyltransferase [Ralstonia sp. NFACC01]|uniref:DNA cytosine methyltransferase n=1 Tax=Ralstonia sp. NFACC01 TaxID=1566294 RepID=UPI0008E02A05|nr:DNA (cytosine-5)-methyltransferase 1 [Ralstonia sp. NFACC01]
MFCGGGGSSLGARAAGVQVIGGVDLWTPATEAFKLNFPEATVFNKDLRKLTPASVIKQLGEIDLLLSSPECTHHTCARGNKPRSEESKETALQVIRYAKAMRPRWIILENVVHMRPWERYPELKEKLLALGYKLREQVLDASDFGVPQKRRRLFLLADALAMPSAIQAPLRSIATAESILDTDGTWPMTPLRTPNRAKGTLERAERAIAKLGNATPFLIVYYGSDGSGGWQSLDVPLRTVTTVDRFALVRPSAAGHMMRMLQPSEIRRAMGFPDGYVFPEVTRRERVKLLGNAVCSPVMEAIIRSLCQPSISRRSALPPADEHGLHSDEQLPPLAPVAA